MRKHPGGSNKWIYFRKQNVESWLGPDILSALSLMHEPEGSFPFLIKKRTRCRRKTVQAACSNRGGCTGHFSSPTLSLARCRSC